ncbi:tetratricopeptide repeat protein 9C-like [Actinia tenebrosa]|uniref:Tetratricopeptide repeat protein 9C-like n=1 Tax=Actinia tenebrosa TaxID=6105 RepID=A0A6P8HFN3_ACTTE|nr:tetratricopeptide repeat protein 9C-like [Actinia tenebrosa]
MADETQSTDNCDNSSKETKKTPILTKAEKLEQARILKDEGNAFYKQKDYKNAMKKYHQALMYVKGLFDQVPFQGMFLPETRFPDEETAIFKEKAQQIELSCFNNLAACHLAGGRWSKVLDNSSKVLQRQPDNAKALYRRGQAYMKLQDIDRAKEDLKRASELEPTDNSIKRTLILLEKEYKKITEKEKKTYAAMFEKMSV